MSELFKKEYQEAEEKLYKKGYYVDNMIYYPECFEVSDKSGKVIIDTLSLSQLIQLSNILG